MERLFASNAEKTIKEKVLNYEKRSYYLIGETPIAFVGENDVIDKLFCYRNGITIINLGYKGGIIIGDIDDINICYIIQEPEDNEFIETYMSFADYLSNKGLDTRIDGNDILIGGRYKVASYSVTKFEFNYLCTFHISMNVNTQYIKLLCKKPMIKIPCGLSSFGLTKNDVLFALHIP